MKRKRFSVEQIVAAVKQHDLGVSATDIARKLGDLTGVFCTSRSERGSHEGGSWTCRSESTKQSRL